MSLSSSGNCRFQISTTLPLPAPNLLEFGDHDIVLNVDTDGNCEIGVVFAKFHGCSQISMSPFAIASLLPSGLHCGLT